VPALVKRVYFTPNYAGLRNVTTAPTGPVGGTIYQRGRRVQLKAQQLAPVRTGDLRSLITLEFSANVQGVPVATIASNAHYSRYVHDGTGIFGPRRVPIRPVRGRYLRFTARGGRVVFARQVRGQPAKPFLRDALDAAL